jgi:hypothetical protein
MALKLHLLSPVQLPHRASPIGSCSASANRPPLSANRDDTTRATAHLPGLVIEIIHRRSPYADAEQISINLRAVPSFEAFGRYLETADPFAFWAQAAQMAWLPWLGAARTLMLPWSGHRKSHQGGDGRAERVRMGLGARNRHARMANSPNHYVLPILWSLAFAIQRGCDPLPRGSQADEGYL